MLRICIQALFYSLMYIVIPQYNWGLVLDLPLTPETRNSQGPCISCHHRYALNYLCIMYTTQYGVRTKANTCTTYSTGNSDLFFKSELVQYRHCFVCCLQSSI